MEAKPSDGHGHAGHVPLGHHPSTPHLTSHVHLALELHLAPLHQPTPALVEKEANNRRTSRAQVDQTMPMASPMDTYWPRAAPTLCTSPGPPLSTVSFTAVPATHHTSSRVLASAIAVDHLAVFPAPVPPGTNLARAHLAVPHLASKRSSFTWTLPTQPCSRMSPSIARIAAPLSTSPQTHGHPAPL
jgi:hypothetical protein